MNTKTFEAIEKLKEVELELHRLKNALEMANKSLDAQRTWVGLTDEEIGNLSDFAYANDEEFVRNVEKHLKEKNNG